MNWERVVPRLARRNRPRPGDDFATQTMGLPKGKAESEIWTGVAGREMRNAEHGTPHRSKPKTVAILWTPFRHLAIAHRRAALRADIMPQPLHVARVLEQVLVNVFAEDDLLLHRDRRIEIHLASLADVRVDGVIPNAQSKR